MSFMRFRVRVPVKGMAGAVRVVEVDAPNALNAMNRAIREAERTGFEADYARAIYPTDYVVPVCGGYEESLGLEIERFTDSVRKLLGGEVDIGEARRITGIVLASLGG